jgi:hypothetical protein
MAAEATGIAPPGCAFGCFGFFASRFERRCPFAIADSFYLSRKKVMPTNSAVSVLAGHKADSENQNRNFVLRYWYRFFILQLALKNSTKGKTTYRI